MSKIVMNVCDFCGKETESKDFYKVKVKSDSFVNEVNFDAMMPDRRTFDICRKCIEEFKAWQLWREVPTTEPEPSDVARDIARIIENEIDMRVIAQSERKKGEWLDTETSYADGVRQECRCSVCSRLSPRPLGDFCRWCGADMRGKDDE